MMVYHSAGTPASLYFVFFVDFFLLALSFYVVLKLNFSEKTKSNQEKKWLVHYLIRHQEERKLRV